MDNYSLSHSSFSPFVTEIMIWNVVYGLMT